MLALFAGKSVETLHVYFTDPNDHLQTTSIWSAASRNPNLKALCIIRDFKTQFYWADKHLLCSSWSQLDTLDIPITDGAIVHLASLPHLRDLSVDYEHTIPIQDHLTSSDNNFPSLRELSLCSRALPSVMAFLRYLPPRNCIQSLLCRTAAIASAPDSQRLLAAISALCNPDTLETLDLSDNGNSVHESEHRHSLERIDILGLFKFKKLTSLSVDFTGGIWATPEEVRQIPGAWPNLESLELDLTNRRVPRIDHKDVLKVVYNCQSLITLGLPFDATKVQGAERNLFPGPGVDTPALFEFFVGYSPILSPSRVIQLLTAHIPALDTVRSQWNSESEDDEEDQYYDRWEFVRDHF
jgi:hypothetical protein